MHMSGPSRKKDENIFSDVYFISLTVVLIHSTAYVQAHILNFLPVISLPAPWVWERESVCVCVCVCVCRCVCVCVCVCVRESVSEVKSSLLYCQFFHMYSTYIQRIEIALLSDPWCIQLTLNTDSRHSNTDKYSLTICTYKLYRYTNEDIVEKNK